jgi:hypothetical protein
MLGGMRSDPGLRGLDPALDPDRMLPVVAQAVGLAPDGLAGLRCVPEVITHKPGRRCVIRYALSRSAGPSAGSPSSVFGKVYVSRRRATRMHDQTEALRRSGVPSIPACLRLVGSVHLVLQECVEGEQLGQLLGSPRLDEPISLAARWLARLHATPPLAGLKAIPSSRSLEKASDWLSEIGERLGGASPVPARLPNDLAAVLAGLPGYTPSMIHRDYHAAHVLWSGTRIWILDFDELSVGDPALDVGHFLGQLEYEAFRRTGRPDAFEETGALFLRTYHEAAGLDPRPSLPFYRAYTFAKLAHKEACDRHAGWRRRVETLLDLVHREVASGSKPPSR